MVMAVGRGRGRRIRQAGNEVDGKLNPEMV